MLMYANRLLVSIVILLCHCNALNAKSLVINGVSHSPSYLEPSANAVVAIKFRVNSPSEIALKLYDDRDLLVKSISRDVSQGDQIVYWDLTDNSGSIVPSEAYRYTISAGSANGSVTYDASDITGGAMTRVENVVWDKSKKEIKFVLQHNSRVSINSGILDGGPLLSTILDWVPMTRGQHAVKWDGMDPAGTTDVSNIIDQDIITQAYSLSDNTIIVGPPQIKSSYITTLKWGEVKRDRNPMAQSKIYNYSAKTAESRESYKIDLTLPDNVKNTNDKLPILSGAVPVRISMSTSTMSRMRQDRFEPMLFVDGKFVSELETGFLPLTWKLDTNKYANGKHYVTVNIRGYDGQHGTTTKFIHIKN